MKKLGVTIVGICLLLPIFRPTISVAESEIPEVIINEVAWAGSSISSSDEWIELKNTTNQDKDIAGWQITKNTGSETVIATIPSPSDPDQPSTHIIPANDYFLIARKSQEDPESVLDIAPNQIIASSIFSLSNTKLKISLYNGPYQTSQLIDVAGEGENPFWGNSGDIHISMERNATYGTGDMDTSWHPANASSHLDQGAEISNKGTPKDENSTPPPPAPTIDHMVPEIPAPATLDTDFVIVKSSGNILLLLKV